MTSHRISRLALIAAAFLICGSAAAQSETATLNLGVGQQRTLQVGNVARIAIGDPEVADVKQIGGGNELLVTGVSEGRTSLLVWRQNDRRLSYSVVVRKQDPKELVAEVRALLGDREGVRIRVVGDRIVLEGETLSGEDEERVQQILLLYPSVKSFVRASANAKRVAAESLNRALQRAGLRGAQASAVGSTLILEGSLESKEDIAKADLLVKAAGEKAENLLTIGNKRMVLVEVEFVEAASSEDKRVGIKPPSNLVSTESSGGLVHVERTFGDKSGTQGAVIADLGARTDFSLGARFDRGASRVLARPRLVCASGEKAEFAAGGEVPVVVVTQSTHAIEYKKFGVILNVTPTVDRQGNIGTAIYAEVSDVDRSLAVRVGNSEVPGFRLRDVKTNVTVKDGETIILSGLFNAGEDKGVSKIPFLGHIPILGELFKSRSFQERKTELAITITPRIAAPDSEHVRELIEDARKLHKDAGESVSFNLFD